MFLEFVFDTWGRTLSSWFLSYLAEQTLIIQQLNLTLDLRIKTVKVFHTDTWSECVVVLWW